MLQRRGHAPDARQNSQNDKTLNALVRAERVA
jgi:hypothetical protein